MLSPDVVRSWSNAGETIPLDLGGPVDISFEPFETAWIERPIVARFEEIAERNADKLAVDDGVRRLTYGDLRRAVHRLAQEVDTRVPAGRPVGILLPNNALFPIAALACLAVGRPYVPIDSKYPAARNDYVMRDSGLAAVIVDAAGPSEKNSAPAGQAVPGGLSQIDVAGSLAGAGEPPRVAIAPAAGPALILYTSGSTGLPKGICNDQRAILQRVAQFTNASHLHSGDCFALLSSPGTIAGVRDTFAALLNGATLLTRDPNDLGIRGVLQALQGGHATIGYAVPALLRALLRAPGAKEAFRHLRIMRLGGDIVLAGDLALCRAVFPPSCHVRVGLGSTEVPTVCQWFVPPDWNGDSARLPLGYAQPDVSTMIVDEDGAPVATGEAGELVVRSRYLALGHWQDGRLQPGPFAEDPSDPSQRIMRTGDLVKLRQDGLWEIVGRTDRQVKIRGLRADAREVEAALRNCAEVVDAAVIARRSGEEVVALIAYVVPRAPAGPELATELKRALSLSVPAHMRPAEIRFLDAIPRLPGFKPDIPELERLDQRELERRDAAALDRGAEVPMGATGSAPIRDAVERAWTMVLDHRSFAADLPWDEAGGDSLKAMQLWFHVEAALGRKLALDALDARSTPSRLVAAITEDLNSDAERGGRHRDNGQAPLVFLMPGISGDEPLLARFRAAFGDDLRFKVIDYPGWHDTMDSKCSFDAIVDAVFAQVSVARVDGPYRLLGYSFGGSVAYQTACRLVASGRPVGFVGLLDTRRLDLARPARLRRFRKVLAEPSRISIVMLRSMLTLLVRRRWFGLLRAAGGLIMARPSTMAYGFHRHLIEMLRYDALRRWRPMPLDAPTTLFLSQEHLPGAPIDYGWGDLCAPLTVVHIGGSHASMLEPPLRDKLRAHLLEVMQSVSSPSGADGPDGRVSSAAGQ